MSFLNNILVGIINFFYGIIPNYGVAIILFTIFIKACLSPLDLKSRRSMRRMSAVNPKMEELKKKYANDQEKLNQKMSELYKDEKINPLSGCLPMLLTMPILFAMFAAMRMVANDQLVSQYLHLVNGITPDVESFLWIKNLWMPDNFAKAIMPDAAALQVIGQDVWERVSATLVANGTLPDAARLVFENSDAFKAFTASLPEVIASTPAYAQYLEITFNVPVLLFSFDVFRHPNGYFVLPILAVLTQFVSQKIMNANQGANNNAAGQQAGMGKTMMMLMPLMSLFFCATSSSAFAIYWVMSNIIATVQQIAFNKYFEWQDRKVSVAQEVGIQ